jgi:uncharacterized membrane protein
MESPTPQIESTSDDRLWVLLGYIFSPLIPIVIMFMADKKERPFVKAHNMQALVLGVVMIVLAVIVSVVTLGLGSCLTPLLWIYSIYLGIKAYRGEMVTIPVISNFVRNQGW